MYKVFNDPRAVSVHLSKGFVSVSDARGSFQSDPTHSFLSKDHFVSVRRRSFPSRPRAHVPCRSQNLILNEPAGNLAKIVVVRGLFRARAGGADGFACRNTR